MGLMWPLPGKGIATTWHTAVDSRPTEFMSDESRKIVKLLCS
jgi:hypothetical protein